MTGRHPVRGILVAGVSLVLSAAVLVAPAAAAQAPPNDDIGNATAIDVPPFWDLVDMAGATAAPEDPPCGAGGLSVWYVYTADRDGEVTFELFESEGTTAVSVYQGTPGALDTIGCAEGWLPVTVSVVEGTTYYVLATVDPAGDVGVLYLHVSVTHEIKLTVDPAGGAGPDGHAKVSGTVTCTWPMEEGYVSGTVRQLALGRLLVGAHFTVAVGSCDGVVPWAATTSEESYPATGFLRGGRALVSAYALGCDWEWGCAEDRADVWVRLRPARVPDTAQDPRSRRSGSRPK